MDTHTSAFFLSTGRDEIGLESVPNNDMSVVVCVQYARTQGQNKREK